MDFDRITIDPEIMGGVPCIRGLRIPVATIVTMVAEGMTTDEILADLPDLEPEDIRAALGTQPRPCRRATSPSRREVPARQQSLRPLVGLLSEEGHDTAHVRDYGMQSASDSDVLERARAEGRALISADTDFGRILARSGATTPSVVLLLRRRTGRRAQGQAFLVLANLDELVGHLEAGSLVVLEERGVRVRRLPIR